MASKERKIDPPQDNSIQGEFIRRFKTNPFIFIGTIIVLIIVIVAFVFVPAIVPSAGGLGVDLSFGSYDKTPITYVPGNYFSQVREIRAQELARSSEQDIANGNFMQNYQVWRRAFEDTVIHIATLDEMQKAGYTIPAEVVNRRMAQLPQFQENGVFSVALYRALDKQTRMSLWRQVQESIVEEYYRTDILQLRVSSKEAPFITAMGSPQRTFDMVAFPLQTYPDTEISAYAAAHPDLFKVTHLSQITITSSEREAKQILTTIQEGTATFEDTARSHSQDGYADKGGDMGIRMAYEFNADVPDPAERESLMKLAKGELSGLLKVKINDTDGWAFFRVEDDPLPADTSDSGLLEKIRSYIMTYERGQVEDFLLNQADTFIAAVKENGFEEALLQSALEKRTFGPLPINYGGAPLFNSLAYSGVSEIANAEKNENFWQIAFSTPLNTPSKSFVLENNVVVLYPLEETAANERNTEYMESNYGSYLLPSFLDENIRDYFLRSKKLQDRFWDTFTKIYAVN